MQCSALLVATLITMTCQAPMAGEPRASWSFDAALGRPVETAVSPRGRVAWVIAGQGGSRLMVDGRQVDQGEAIEQVEWTRDGELAYWVRTSRGEQVVTGNQRGQRWESIRTPELGALAAAQDPGTWTWLDRGGAKVMFAARDPQDPDRWVSLTRRPSQPSDLERRPLPTTRRVQVTSDPSLEKNMARRYHLVAGRVPAYVAHKGREECLVVGQREMACGVRIEMIASAPRTGRLLVAWREREGEDLYLADGLEVTGPWRRIDWAAFSSDGLRYAALVVDREGEKILTDQGLVQSPGTLAALSFDAKGDLVVLRHLEDRYLLTAGDKLLSDEPVITAFLRGPTAAPTPVIRRNDGYHLGAPLSAEGFRMIWAEGFLADGRIVAQVTPREGGQGLFAGDRVMDRGDALTSWTASSDGTHLLTVTRDLSGKVERIQRDGEAWLEMDEVGGMGFIGPGPVAMPWVQGRRGAETCLWTGSTAGSPACCREVIGWTGGPAAPVLLCESETGPQILEGGEVLPVDELPREFLQMGSDGRVLWFVSRLGEAWRLHAADGRVVGLPGRPRMLLGGQETGDHPRILVDSADGQGWCTGAGSGDRYDAELASIPFEEDGLDPIYAARSGGLERWVSRGRVTNWVQELGSPPFSAADGFSWWERRGGHWHWAALLYDDVNDTPGGVK